MELFVAVLTAVDGQAAKPPNLWGALGCALAYSAAMFATVDSFADLIVARGAAGATRLSAALKLKFGSKLAAAAVTVVAAGLVLALDSNWFAFSALTAVFVVFVAISWIVVVSRRAPSSAARTSSGEGARAS